MVKKKTTKKTTKKNKGGRPLKFSSVKKMQDAIDSYFAKCLVVEKKVKKTPIGFEEDGKTIYNREIVDEIVMKEPPSITGLAVHLGTGRQGIKRYLDSEEDGGNKGSNDKFRDAIKEAKEKIEHYTMLRADTGKTPTAFAIFNLKNNFGWVDEETKNITGNVIGDILGEISEKKDSLLGSKNK